MKRIVILGNPQRIDHRVVRSLNRLFPECTVHIVDAGAPDRLEMENTLEGYNAPAETVDGATDPP